MLPFFSEFSFIQKILYVLYVMLFAAFSISMPILYFMGIIRRKYVVKAELISWRHNKYSSDITCDIGITNLAQPPFLIKSIYIKPAFNSSSFRKKRYVGTIQSDKKVNQFPLSLSVLQKKKITISFSVDLSHYYHEEYESKDAKQWTLIFKTNRLERNFKIDAPF